MRTRSTPSSQPPLLTTRRYLCARFDDINEATLRPKMVHYAKAGHVLALHTPLVTKARPFAPLLYFPYVPHLSQEFCDGVFGDSFFSKQNVSSERDAKKIRNEVQSMACIACVDAQFSRAPRLSPFCRFYDKRKQVCLLRQQVWSQHWRAAPFDVHQNQRVCSSQSNGAN